MTTRIQLRRGIATEWANANPTLALGESGIETDTLTWKVGDGVTAWNDLPYMAGGAGTGNIGFVGDAIYDINGITIENADLSHGATAAVILPANGSSSAIQVNNIYGNIALQTGNSGNVTGTWLFDPAGNLTLPGGAKLTAGAGNTDLIAGPDGWAELASNNGDNYIWLDNNGAYIATGALTQFKQWTFGEDGNLTLPDDPNVSINYANGQPYGGGGGGNVNTGNIGFDNYNIYNTQGQGVTISNFNFATAEAETAYVNIPAGNSPADLQIVQEQGNVTVVANTKSWTFDTSGNITIPASGWINSPTNSNINLHPGGNGLVKIQGSNDVLLEIQGDVANTLNRVEVDTFGTSNTLGGTFTGRFSRGTIEAPEVVQSGDRLASLRGKGYNGSYYNTPTGIVSIDAVGSWDSTNTPTRLSFWTTPFGSNLPQINMILNQDGNLTINNGNINLGGGGHFFGDPATGDGAIYAGLPSFTELGSNVVAQFSGNTNSYSQINFQNISDGTQASGDFIITANNGTDSANFINMGIAGNTWDGSQPNSLGNSVLPNDGYLYVNGANLVVGTAVGANVKTWNFDNTGTLTFPDNSGSGWPINQQRFGMGNIGAWLDGEWTIGEFSGNGVSGNVGIRIDPAIEGPVGMTFPRTASSNTQPVQIYSTNGSGISLYTGGPTWLFDSAGALNLPASAPFSSSKIQTANSYSTILAYGSGGHGGPELDWMNADDPANTFGNVNTLRNTMYINGGGLYVGINENETPGNAVGNLTFDNNANLTVSGNIITSGAGGNITMTGGNIIGSGAFIDANLVVQTSSATVTCNAGAPTVIYSSTDSSYITVKLIIQVEGVETSGIDAQSCEMLVARGLRNNTVIGSVYALTYTSVSPLATFNAAWNATTSRIDVSCTPVSLTNAVYVRVSVTEIQTSI